jgi:acyl-CoA thioesterase-1
MTRKPGPRPHHTLRAAGIALLALSACGKTEPPKAADSASVQATAASPSVVPASPDAPAPKLRAGAVILFAGTSLTAGLGLDPDQAYPQLVQRKIDSAGLKFTVVNAGVSGETSAALLRRLNWLMREPFDVIVIETGANDGLRGIPVATMERNIQAIIDGVRAARPAAQIVLVQMEAPPNLGTPYTAGFREVFPSLARRNSVVLMPFLLDGVAGVRHLNQSDGIHPNEEGARLVAANVWKALKPLIQ